MADGPSMYWSWAGMKKNVRQRVYEWCECMNEGMRGC